MTADIYEVLRHLRALQLPEDATPLQELETVQALVALFDSKIAKEALITEHNRVEEQIDKMTQAIMKEPYHDVPAKLVLGGYYAAVLGMHPYALNQQYTYLLQAGLVPVEIIPDYCRYVVVKGQKQIEIENKKRNRN